MMKAIFYGDSITEGYNNNGVSFVDKLDIFSSCKKYGVSGTTIGEYPIYPVDGHSLISQITNSEADLVNADIVFLEYGINDCSAVCLNRINLISVLIDIRRSIDLIHQINSRCKVIFLSVGSSLAIKDIAESQVSYLQDYFGNISNTVDNYYWVRVYNSIIKYVQTFVDFVCPMFLDSQDLLSIIDTDGIHPNDEGYSLIADNIVKFINGLGGM